MEGFTFNRRWIFFSTMAFILIPLAIVFLIFPAIHLAYFFVPASILSLAGFYGNYLYKYLAARKTSQKNIQSQPQQQPQPQPQSPPTSQRFATRTHKIQEISICVEWSCVQQSLLIIHNRIRNLNESIKKADPKNQVSEEIQAYLADFMENLTIMDKAMGTIADDVEAFRKIMMVVPTDVTLHVT
jgi:hypothetical protein